MPAPSLDRIQKPGPQGHVHVRGAVGSRSIFAGAAGVWSPRSLDSWPPNDPRRGDGFTGRVRQAVHGRGLYPSRGDRRSRRSGGLAIVNKVAQFMNDGRKTLRSVSGPAVQPRRVLIVSAFAPKSAVTEKMILHLATRTPLGKARERPDRGRRVGSGWASRVRLSVVVDGAQTERYLVRLHSEGPGTESQRKPRQARRAFLRLELSRGVWASRHAQRTVSLQ
jgi:hypothetical protein